MTASTCLITLALSMFVMTGPVEIARGQTGTPPTTTVATPNGPPPPAGGNPWPRSITVQSATLNVFQPQPDSWKGNLLEAYAAVTVVTPGKQDKNYGVIWFTARTEVDKVNRVVTLDDFKITEDEVPNGSRQRHGLCQRAPSRPALEAQRTAGRTGDGARGNRGGGAAEDVHAAEQPACDLLQHHARVSGPDRRSTGASPHGRE